MTRIPQSVTIRIPLKAYDSTDHISAKTGLTLVIKLSLNGAAFANPSGGATNATEISNGWYYVDLSTTDTGTLGPLIIRGTSSGADDVEQIYQVVKATNGGFSALPDAAAEAAGGLFTRGSGAGQINQEDNGYISVNLKAILRTALTETVGGNLTAAFKKFFDVAASVFTTATINQTGDSFGRLGAPAGASVSADVAAIKAVLPAALDANGFIKADVEDWKGATAPAMTGDAYARLGAPAGASVSADIAAVNAKTTNLPAAPADETLIITATNAIVNRLSTIVTKTGAVQTDAGNSALTFKTNLTESANDHYKDCMVKFTSGALTQQVKKVRAYDGTTKFLTMTGAFTGTPAAADAFEIIND